MVTPHKTAQVFKRRFQVKRVLAVLLALTICFPSASLADSKIKGIYEVVGPIENLKGAKQIEMIEFFNYSCGHCYKFLETSKILRAKYKDKLHHKKYPIYWGGQTPYPAMAFYISDEQGIEEKFTQELFDTNFKMSINIFQPNIIKFLAREFNIEKAMLKGMQSERIKSKVAKSVDYANQYKTNETPTIIINKALKVAPSMVEGNVKKMTKNLEDIFDDILN